MILLCRGIANALSLRKFQEQIKQDDVCFTDKYTFYGPQSEYNRIKTICKYTTGTIENKTIHVLTITIYNVHIGIFKFRVVFDTLDEFFEDWKTWVKHYERLVHNQYIGEY